MNNKEEHVNHSSSVQIKTGNIPNICLRGIKVMKIFCRAANALQECFQTTPRLSLCWIDYSIKYVYTISSFEIPW